MVLLKGTRLKIILNEYLTLISLDEGKACGCVNWESFFFIKCWNISGLTIQSCAFVTCIKIHCQHTADGTLPEIRYICFTFHTHAEEESARINSWRVAVGAKGDTRSASLSCGEPRRAAVF